MSDEDYPFGSPKIATSREVALGIPYIYIQKEPSVDGDFTVIYLHPNGEDMFSSLTTARYLSKLFRVESFSPGERNHT